MAERVMCDVIANAKRDVRSPTVMNDDACRASTPDFRHYARCCSLEMETN